MVSGFYLDIYDNLAIHQNLQDIVTTFLNRRAFSYGAQILWSFKNLTVSGKVGFEIKGINYGPLQIHVVFNPETTAYKTERN